MATIKVRLRLCASMAGSNSFLLKPIEVRPGKDLYPEEKNLELE
jgi:hypothetical protein